MTWKFYLKNIVWPLIPVLLVFIDWKMNNNNEKLTLMLIGSFISCILYPFSKKLVENIALKFSTKAFWQKDFFTSSTGGSFQAILFIFCFIFAMPLGISFLFYGFLKALTRKG